MAKFDLIEKQCKPRKMLQPTKNYIRAELKLAEAEIADKQELIDRQQSEIQRLRRPWWKRLLRKSA